MTRRNETALGLRRLFVGAALASILGGGAVSAYVVMAPARTWDAPPVYIVDERGSASVDDGDGGLSATIRALESRKAWNGAGAGRLLTATAGSVAGLDTSDGIPMLSFDDPFHACNGNCLAATWISSYEDRDDGTVRVLDADIITNEKFDWTTEDEPGLCEGEFFLESVMVHEVGHGLGLDHSSVEGSTMYPSVAACDNGAATLSPDDEEGILFLYGGPGIGPACDLAQKGDVCTTDAECCSGRCRGPGGAGVCR